MALPKDFLNKGDYESRPMSNFQKRGDDLKNGFASRFGGGMSLGGFSPATQIAQTFGSNVDIGEMIKKVVTTDTKNISTGIASALDNKAGGDGESEKTTMPEDEALKFINQVSKNEDKKQDTPEAVKLSANRFLGGDFSEENLYTPRPPELTPDPTIAGGAAALQTTSNATMSALQGVQIPEALRALMDTQRMANLQQFRPNVPEEPTIEPPPIPPTLVEEPEPTPPPIPEKEDKVSGQFQDVVGKIFGKESDDVPDDYKLSELNVTYKKVQPTEPDEELDSVDVTATVAQQKEEPTATEVPEEPGPTVDQRTPSYYEDDEEDSNDPWERFKRMYESFYSPDTNKSAYSAAVKSFAGSKDMTSQQQVQLGQKQAVSRVEDYKSDLMSNTDQILRAKAEKDNLRDFTNMAADRTKEITTQQPLILNRTNTVIAKDPGGSRTSRVFTDDNTFSRLSSNDAQHPQYARVNF